MTGAPLVYQAVRNEGGKAFEDWVRAPRAAFVGEEWSLDGPVEAVVHFAEAASALRLGVAPGAGTSDDASTPAPIRVLAKGGAVVRPDLMRLLGGVEAQQGRKDRGGFEARARDATFLIVPGADGSNDFSFAALRGEASFRSSGLTADGDVMTFDRPASTLTLYNERPAPVRFRVEGGFEAPTVVGATGLVAVFGKRTVYVTVKDVSTILEEENAAGAGERK